MTDKKIMIAYYSYSGNTRAVAEKIQSITGGDLFEIIPVTDYPKEYNAVVNQAQIEKEKDVKPELINDGNIDAYNIIFIGTPVW